ncbi:polymorphic toxin-type HINT domain-containing protein [Kribbella sp. NPDC050470]|uniref:polymorphic toxin-type HINT domain-containing protein n=1 Tax=unclassified Kribbella TaxID=2644121 RepID=UPI0037AA9810
MIDLEIDGEVVTTTEDHPFWNATDHMFQRADQLDAGDRLLTPTNETERVVGIRPGSQQVATAYNLTVDGTHTYYVIVGNKPVLVHNTCGPNLDAMSAAGRALDKNGLTVAGRAYQKHMARGQLPKVGGKELNSAAHNLLDDILTDPRSDFQSITQGGFKGGTRVISNNIVNKSVCWRRF